MRSLNRPITAWAGRRVWLVGAGLTLVLDSLVRHRP